MLYFIYLSIQNVLQQAIHSKMANALKSSIKLGHSFAWGASEECFVWHGLYLLSGIASHREMIGPILLAFYKTVTFICTQSSIKLGHTFAWWVLRSMICMAWPFWNSLLLRDEWPQYSW